MSVDVAAALSALNKIASRTELFSAGVSRHAVERAASTNQVIRPRLGWYALPDADQQVVRAVRVGGRLASVSACAAYGLWTLPDSRLHVQVLRESSRLRSPDDPRSRLEPRLHGVVVHRNATAAIEFNTRLTVSLIEALCQVIRGETDEQALVCLDSARNLGLLDLDGLSVMEGALGRVHHAVLSRSSPLAESGLETLARVRLGMAGIPCKEQVWVARGIRVDLLVGDCLAIELDGREFHSTVDAFESDRERDALLKGLGFEVLRLSYRQVMFDWEASLSVICALIERRRHSGARPIHAFLNDSR